MRTTITVDRPLLAKIRDISHREHKTLTRVIQELLAFGITARLKRTTTPSPFRQWNSKKMGAQLDYKDKDVLYRTLDQKA